MNAWNCSSFQLTYSSDSKRIEEALGWPRGVLEVLKQAFELKLSRFCPWDLRGVEDVQAFAKAAQIYKRGVSTIPELEIHQELKAKNGTYDIELIPADQDPISQLEAYLSSCFIIADSELCLHWPRLQTFVDFMFLADENHKDLEQMQTLIHGWKSSSQAKSTWMIIGGGICGDVALFAADCVEVPCLYVPSTLLAMVDASIGGKSGVNFAPYGKNLLGSFYFPQKVMISLDWLRTLPDREWRSGASECMKHAFIKGDLEALSKLCEVLRNKDHKGLAPLLLHLLEVKKNIVTRDPTEVYERAVLNLGHTLGHALEAQSQYQIRHGEAVSVGLVFAFSVAVHKQLMTYDHALQLIEYLKQSATLISRNELEIYLGQNLDAESLWTKLFGFMQQDKKNQNQDVLSMVLLSDLGKISKTNDGSFVHSVFQGEAKYAWNLTIKSLS